MLALVICSLALVPYFTFSEISRVIGADKLHALLFKRAQKPGGGQGMPAPQT